MEFSFNILQLDNHFHITFHIYIHIHSDNRRRKLFQRITYYYNYIIAIIALMTNSVFSTNLTTYLQSEDKEKVIRQLL